MKTLALTLALILQTTGIWPHLPDTQRERIASRATGRVLQPVPATAAPTSSVTSLGLPIRTGTEAAVFGPTASIVALDRATGTPLYTQNDHRQRPLASVTKLVTVLVILSRHDPAELVTIPTLPSYIPEAELLGLSAGETYRLGDLVKAALIPSANDAADALALYDSGSLTKFAAQMNLKLSSWGIEGGRFSGPSGLQDAGNSTTAEALGRIALLALQNPLIRDTVAQASVSLTSTGGRTLTGTTTNKLLATSGFYGIKTGYTLAAGQCFVGLTRINGHEVITVILGSSDRFGETQTLVNWIGRNYQWL